MLPYVRKGVGGRALVRWRRGDLLFGASDLKAWELVQEMGWRFYMRLDFHGKVYSVPGAGILVGSANTTGNGLGFTSMPNSEVCTLVQSSDGNLDLIEKLFSGATLVTEDIFVQLKIALTAAPLQGQVVEEWPKSVMDVIEPQGQYSTVLFVGECLWTDLKWLASLDNFGEDALHDLSLIGMTETESIDRTKLERLFRKSAIYKWLVKLLESNNGECYFGRLSAELHAALADDPVPQRRDVKVLLQNLLEWVGILEIKEISIDRPNHSQRIRLVR